jgi:hypothetical protein
MKRSWVLAVAVLAVFAVGWSKEKAKDVAREKAQKGSKSAVGGADPVFAAAQKPLTEPGFYEKDGKKYERGLYPGGTNEIPKAHLEARVRLARTIAPDSNGRIVLTAIGHSNPKAYFKEFLNELRTKAGTGEINPKVDFVSNCKSGKICPDWLKEAQEGALSVKPETQALIVLTTYHRAGGDSDGGDDALPFEEKMGKMKAAMKTIVQAAAKTCPNLKIAFIGCDTWRAKCEPRVYEEGFAEKWLIEDQIKGDPELAFEGPGRKAPWLCWGGYIWEPSAPAERYEDDRVHPTEAGMKFVCDRWFGALAANPAAYPWFYPKAPAGGK